ncbi:MAG: cation-translocating P-type ATPase [Pseudomonadota bacterium]
MKDVPSPSSQPDHAAVWHALPQPDAAARLQVAPRQGLSDAEAARRLDRHGANRLVEPAPRPAWRKFIDQFKSLLIVILLGAAGVALWVGDLLDMAVILSVVLLNALLGFYQEYRAGQSLGALKKMLALKARVRRGGRHHHVAAEALVPGDIVLLEAGDKLPADGRLLQSHAAEIDESVLTGESTPVAKDAATLAPSDAPLAERANMAYMNSVVTRGRLEMLVTATGMTTEIGRIAGLMQHAAEPATPLQTQLDRLGKRLAAIAATVVTLIFALALYQGAAPAQAALTAITLAVAAIPEGLPAMVTITLALGMRRMAAQQAVVKRLTAVETLGCTTVICSDKTGTLTLNQMTVRAFLYAGQRYAVSGEGYTADGEIRGENGAAPADLSALLLPAALCNDSRIRDGRLIGDPTEGALAAWAAKGGVDRDAAVRDLPRIAEIPFDTANKFMATFHRDGEDVRVFVKGAPDVLLARCTQVLMENQRPLTTAARDTLTREIEAMAARGLRVLALASRRLPAVGFEPAGDAHGYLDDLCLLGLVGIMDPPRPEARAAIALCRQAGIQVKMITGDHPTTAVAIARELGLRGAALTGSEMDKLEENQLAGRIDTVSVFARVAPEHKVKIVEALRARGHVVAMTGDGVNDAPALKSADIGVAMGITGSEVSKEAGAMVLMDDNFASIVHAVREGRTLYDNIVKFVRFQLATNLGALGTVLAASLLGWPVPFNPLQILWVNMIMDGPPALALGLDPARPGLMTEPPRDPRAEILTARRLGRLAGFAAIMTAGTLAVFHYGLRSGDATHAATLAFTTFVFFQLFNVFNARAEHASAFDVLFFRNHALWPALLGVLALQIVVVQWPPAQTLFHTSALSFAEWALAAGTASSVLLLEEARKLIMRRHSAPR